MLKYYFKTPDSMYPNMYPNFEKVSKFQCSQTPNRVEERFVVIVFPLMTGDTVVGRVLLLGLVACRSGLTGIL